MKLSKTRIEALGPEPRDYFVWDDELKGFGVRVMPSRRCTYLVQHRLAGRSRRVKIGVHGAVTADEARKRARQLLGAVSKGDDPAEEIAIERKVPTIAHLCDRYLAEHAATHCKPNTQREYARIIDREIRPRFGAWRITDLKRADVAALHYAMRNRRYVANRTLTVLSKMFKLAELWGLRPDGSNPCHLISKYREALRERFLSEDEMQRLSVVRIIGTERAIG